MRNSLPLLFLLVLASPVVAQPLDQAAPRLSDRGRKMVSGELGGYFSTDDQYTPTPRYDNWAVYARPAFTYFLRDRLGLGGSLNAGFGASRQTSRSDFGLGVHALYDLALGPTLSLFMVPSVSYAKAKRGQQYALGGASVGYDLSYLRIALSLPLAFHVSDSVAIGFGPDLWVDRFLTRRTANGAPGKLNRVQVGMSTWIGVSF